MTTSHLVENLSKTELASALASMGVEMTPSQIKKTAKADLITAYYDAVKATAKKSEAPKLTKLEQRVLVAYLDAGIDCNGAETLDAMLADNMTWSDTADIAQRTGLSQKQVTGVQSSLSSKGLLVVDCDPVNGEGAVQQVLSDDGIRIAFDLLAEGVEAQAAPKATTPSKPRALAPHVYCQPADEPKAFKEGSKKHLLAAALLNGATIEELMEATGWNRSTVQSGFTNDMKMSGYGVERRDDGKYYLLLPAGVKHLPIATADVTRAAAVSACRG